MSNINQVIGQLVNVLVEVQERGSERERERVPFHSVNTLTKVIYKVILHTVNVFAKAMCGE